MYVKFGKYRNRLQPNNISEKYFFKKYGDDYWDDDFKPNTLDRIIQSVFNGLQNICNKTVNKWWFDSTPRKMKVKIHRFDVWNADHTIACIIHPLLVELAKDKQGAPYVSDEDVPEHIRSTSAAPKADEWDTDEFHFDRWNWVLNELIWTFKQLAKDDKGEEQFYSGEVDWKFDKDDETGLFAMNHGPSHTFKVDQEAKKAHFDRINRGLNLFAKYYMALWT